MALVEGSRLGPYEIRARLGSGGMGVVYRARDPRLGRDVAIKVLPDEVAADAEYLRRFEREARAAGALNHPNVMAIYDVGHATGAAFVVCELLDGETLRDRLRSGALPSRKAIELGVQMAHGVAAAHALGIIHRDLKPENLFLTRDGRLKILDFGLAVRRSLSPGPTSESPTRARETRPGIILGTPGYLSPEQARGHETDERSDIFSLGAVLYEMLAGRRAFSGLSTADTVSAILREDPPPLPSAALAGLERIVRRCLEKNPAERFASARDLAFALEASAEPRTASEPETRAARAVAVLPFNDLTRSPENAHIGIGLADATIAELALAGGLVVRPTAAILRYQDRSAPPQEAARELAVDAIVDGTFQRAGDRLRVTVQLVSAEGRSLWASKIDCSIADLFAMQDEVSRQIADALQAELAAGDRRRQTQGARRAPAGVTYDLYLRGRFHLFHGQLAGVNAAIDAFEQARDQDPTFAPAWAGLGDAYTRMAFEHAPEGDWYERAQAMCSRALEIDPDLAEGRYLRGRLAWTPAAGFDHATAILDAGAALAASPALGAARYLLGLVLFHVGLVAESQVEFTRALAANPSDPYARMHLATCHLHQGRFAEAVALAEACLQTSRETWSWSNLTLGLIRLGRLDEASRAIERLSREHPEYPHAFSLTAVLAAIHGDRPRMRRAFERTEQAPRHFGHYHHAQYDLACALAALGDADAAFDWLATAAGNGYPCSTFFAIDPLLDPLRGRSDFSRLMERLEAERHQYRRLYLALPAPPS